MSEELKKQECKELIAKLRSEMHDLINVISRIDSINRKIKKGAELTDELKGHMDQAVTAIKESIGPMRDDLHQLDERFSSNND